MGYYDKKCNELIEEYGLIRNDFIDSVQIHNIILGLLQQKCLKGRIALWGAGYNNSITSHAAVLLTKYASCLQGVVCLIDSCKEIQGKEYFGHPIIAPEDIEKYNLDLVIISSRSSGESIKKSLEKFGLGIESLDIYQELRDRGIDIHYNFFEERSFYSELYDVRIEYEQAEDDKKADVLRKLIASYMHIKDFYYGIKYIDEYIENGYKESSLLAEFKEKLLNIIADVARKNSERKDDITIHYIDALRAIDVFDNENPGRYKVLKDYLKDSAVFKNIYSTAPTTYESMYSVTTGKMPFTENVYEDRFIFAPEEFPVMMEAIDRNYKINLYSSGEWRIIREDSRVNYVDQIHFTDKLWKMACDTAESSEKTFNYLYYPWELHFPLLCGFHRKKPVPMGFKDVGIVDMSEFIEGQLADCLDYVNLQLDYFKNIVADNGYTVIFSDHSQIVYDEEKCVPFFDYYNYPDRSTHCVMAIKGPGIEHKEYDEVASLVDFNRIFKDFIWERNYKLPERKIAQFQYYSTHNKAFRDVAEEKGLTDYIDGIAGFISKDYLYAVTNTGVKEVYRMGNHRDNIIDTPEGMAYAEEINNNYKIEFPKFLKLTY